MIKKGYKEINLDDILIYSENPRHAVGSSQSDTLKKLFNKVGSQYMYNLAIDINENGLLGSHLPTLVYNGNQKKYIVFEGNRRVACLKILKNPDLLNGIDISTRDRIKKLLETKNTSIEKVYCYITDEDEAFLIMERTHSGEDQGRGIKAWSAKEKGVFAKRQKQKSSTALIITDLMERYKNIDITKKMPFTSIERIFNNRSVKEALEINSRQESSFTKDKIDVINFVIEKCIEESKNQNVSISRLFNKANEIETFCLPIISDYQGTSNKKVSNENKLIQKGKPEEDNNRRKTISLKLKKTHDKFYENQTFNVLDNLKITDDNIEFQEELLEIKSSSLDIKESVVQPNSDLGQHSIEYKYYSDKTKKEVYWQDVYYVDILRKKLTTRKVLPRTILKSSFTNKYLDKLNFEQSEKFKSIMLFLSNEDKEGKYSGVINIVSRMFIEYSFRLYAEKVVGDTKQTVEEKSKSLEGLVNYYCNKIELADPQTFVKHVKRGRKDSTKKLDMLQKSVHYFDVTISNEDIRVIFNNLNIYLEYIYDQVVNSK